MNMKFSSSIIVDVLLLIVGVCLGCCSVGFEQKVCICIFELCQYCVWLYVEVQGKRKQRHAVVGCVQWRKYIYIYIACYVYIHMMA